MKGEEEPIKREEEEEEKWKIETFETPHSSHRPPPLLPLHVCLLLRGLEAAVARYFHRARMSKFSLCRAAAAANRWDFAERCVTAAVTLTIIQMLSRDAPLHLIRRQAVCVFFAFAPIGPLCRQKMLCV